MRVVTSTVAAVLVAAAVISLSNYWTMVPTVRDVFASVSAVALCTCSDRTSTACAVLSSAWPTKQLPGFRLHRARISPPLLRTRQFRARGGFHLRLGPRRISPLLLRVRLPVHEIAQRTKMGKSPYAAVVKRTAIGCPSSADQTQYLGCATATVPLPQAARPFLLLRTRYLRVPFQPHTANWRALSPASVSLHFFPLATTL